MAKLAAPLKLFAYTGRESGLMVVGSPEAMAELSSQLSAKLAAQPAAAATEWPPELLSAAVQFGPYIESQNWRVSFHVEGSIPSERNLLVARGSPPAWFTFATLVLAAVGLLALVRVAWNAF